MILRIGTIFNPSVPEYVYFSVSLGFRYYFSTKLKIFLLKAFVHLLQDYLLRSFLTEHGSGSNCKWYVL